MPVAGIVNSQLPANLAFRTTQSWISQLLLYVLQQFLQDATKTVFRATTFPKIKFNLQWVLVIRTQNSQLPLF